MLFDQQEPSETLQEYVQRFSDLPLKSSRLLPHQGKDLMHTTNFIRNLHNQKLQHYILDKNPHQSKMPLHWCRKGCRTKKS